MRANPERLAWSVLLLSFGICVTLAIACPLAIQSFVNDSTAPVELALSVQQGTALVQRPNSTDFSRVTIERPREVLEGETILVDESTLGMLSVGDPRSDSALADVQLYANTGLTIRAAYTPRFENSPNPHRLNLFVTNGRIRVNVLSASGRPTAVLTQSPQGEVSFSTGTYVVEVTNTDLQVTVREGQAVVSAQGTSVVIEPSQRAVVVLGQPPQGGLSGERNLVADGNFARSDPGAWVTDHGPQDDSEPKGTVSYRNFAGRRAALFDRTGTSHAETRQVQEINRDITDAASVTLHFALFINTQDVPVCGSQGTECPVMVKINYRDTSNAEREWLQGFYAVNDPNNINRPVCDLCSRRFQHQRVPANAWYNFDSGNLIEALNVDPFKPTQITRLTIYAAGHSYRSAVTDVELLVQD